MPQATMRSDPILELTALKCILVEGGCDDLFYSLISEDFTAREYRDIFQCMLDSRSKGEDVCFINVCLRMKSKKWWSDIGSGWFTGKLSEQLPYKPIHVIAPALRELTILRMQEELRLKSGDVQENIEALERARDAYLGLLPSSVKSVTDYKSILEQGSLTGQPTGFFGVDHLTGGMLGGQLIVVGARTGVGKSVFLMNAAAYVAQMGKKVLWVALEMSEREVLQRFCKHLDEKAHPDSLDYIKTMNIVSGAKELSYIESEVLRFPYDLIVLDYLQLCRTGRKFDTEVQELQEITRRLKLLAMNRGTVVLAAAQLNRDMEQQARPPRLSDLRGSGSIEQDADTVILLHRMIHKGQDAKRELRAEEIARDFEGKGDTTVIVDKCRNGSEGIVNMNFDRQRLQFVDSSPKPAWLA